MAIPFRQVFKIGFYLLRKRLTGQTRYPLVLMLEPLFQCNLACAGCGKIDYPTEILQKRLTIEQAIQAVEECQAPVVSIPGGEPLIHKEMPTMVQALVERKKFVYLCTNALLLKKRIGEFKPSPYLCFSIHLDGNRAKHDKSVCREGVYDKVIEAIQDALAKKFRVTINCTLFNNEDPETIADFFEDVTHLGIEGITLSPGYSYAHAPRQDVFLGKRQSKELFRQIFKIKQERKAKWPINHSSLFIDFLCGNQTYQCTPWSNPTFNVFGWQKPCYLLVDEGHTDSFQSLMQDTVWTRYGSGKNPKCQNCMAHCGYEGSAIIDTVQNPLKAFKVFLKGPKTEGPMAPELPILYNQHLTVKTIRVNHEQK
ncbi:MAG TPA: adenosyl-hopene transferase HpnH [Gammaproteobacteria bacterium]|nr:adenosyl-hopene transferase HpnH [Gammaproteobacteria bacterium]